MPPDLLILYSPDAEPLAQRLNQHYSDLMTTGMECLKLLDYPLKPSKVQYIAKATHTLLIVSPKLLNFVSDHVRSCKGLFDVLRPSSTVAAFCGSAKMADITARHQTAFVRSDQWTTVVLDEDNTEFSQFTRCVLDPLLTAPLVGTSKAEDIEEFHSNKVDLIVLPTSVSKDSVHNSVHVIFTECVCSNINITLRTDEDEVSHVSYVWLNPFALCFKLPDLYLEKAQDLEIRIYCGSKLLSEKKIPFKEEQDEASSVPATDDSNDEDKWFEKYLRILEDDDELPDQTPANSPTTGQEAAKENIVLQRQYAFQEATVHRSSSLPSLVSPSKEETEEDYADMTGQQQQQQVSRPHERFLQTMLDLEKRSKQENLENLFAIPVYTTMKRGGDNDSEDMKLSPSQHELMELMYAVKRGAKTIPEVEALFQDWNQRHRESMEEKEKLRAKNRLIKIQKGRSSELPEFKLLKKPKKKKSKTQQPEIENLNVRPDHASHNERSQKTLSEISNSSNLSSSSTDHSGTNGSNDRTTDSGVLSDNTESTNQKLHDGAIVLEIQDEGPICLLPQRPPPQNPPDTCPRKNWSLPPSPDYIIPNEADLRLPPSSLPPQPPHPPKSPPSLPPPPLPPPPLPPREQQMISPLLPPRRPDVRRKTLHVNLALKPATSETSILLPTRNNKKNRKASQPAIRMSRLIPQGAVLRRAFTEQTPLRKSNSEVDLREHPIYLELS